MVRTPLFLGLVLVAFGAGSVHGQDSIPSIAEKTTGMTALDGFLPSMRARIFSGGTSGWNRWAGPKMYPQSRAKTSQ